jgi:hypothetical protein
VLTRTVESLMIMMMIIIIIMYLPVICLDKSGRLKFILSTETKEECTQMDLLTYWCICQCVISVCVVTDEVTVRLLVSGSFV